MHTALRLESTSAPRDRRRHRRHTLLWAAGILSLLTAVVLMAIPIVQGKTEEPVYALAGTRLSLQSARDADCERWTPEILAEAGAAFQAGQLDARIQHTKFFPFRDYTAARGHLARSEAASKRAIDETFRLRQDALTTATEVMERAAHVVNTTDDFSHAVHMSGYERSLLQKAKINLGEAEQLFEKGEFLLAADAAEEAIDRALRVGDRAATVVARYSDASLVRKWRGWAEDTIAWSRKSGGVAIVVNKEKHQLAVYDNGREVKTYRCELGYNSVRDKTYGGDNATPEGRYRITEMKNTGQSRYHRAMLINYPNEDDRAEFARMRKAGQLPKGVGLGGLIEIHGEGGQGKDWTKGCVALKNSDIDDLWRRVGNGTPVTIVGGDGSGGIYSDILRDRKGLAGIAKPAATGGGQ